MQGKSRQNYGFSLPVFGSIHTYCTVSQHSGVCQKVPNLVDITYEATLYIHSSPPLQLTLHLIRYVSKPKVGIRNLSPHLHNSAILRTTKSIAKLQTKKVAELRLWTFKILLLQFRNSPQSPANSATFWYLFLSSGWF
jgi:hypothetical protein